MIHTHMPLLYIALHHPHLFFGAAFFLPPVSMLLKKNLEFADKRHIQPIPSVAISRIICLFVGPSEVPTLETGSET